ncbi:glutathione S-transferase [Mycena leptocephala]|nr:glutathione S-transferase [Mycena leptocephala]
MVLKLYGAPYSTCTRRVSTVLHEKKIPFELVVVDLKKGEHKAAATLANQPFGQLPYIDDDGFIMYESRAICRYLEDKYPEQGTKLVPSDVQGKAFFEQAASIEYSNFDRLAYAAVAEMVFKPLFRGQPADKAVFDSLIANLSAKLDAYEVILGKQKYLAGNEVTLADLFHLPYATMLSVPQRYQVRQRFPQGIDKVTKSVRWFNDLTARASWVAVKDNIESVSSY